MINRYIQTRVPTAISPMKDAGYLQYTVLSLPHTTVYNTPPLHQPNSTTESTSSVHTVSSESGLLCAVITKAIGALLELAQGVNDVNGRFDCFAGDHRCLGRSHAWCSHRVRQAPVDGCENEGFSTDGQLRLGNGFRCDEQNGLGRLTQMVGRRRRSA